MQLVGAPRFELGLQRPKRRVLAVDTTLRNETNSSTFGGVINTESAFVSFLCIKVY